MQKNIQTTCLLVISLFLVACSEKSDKQETLIDPQLKTLEKAKEVEQILQQSDDARRKQLEEMQK